MLNKSNYVVKIQDQAKIIARRIESKRRRRLFFRKYWKYMIFGGVVILCIIFPTTIGTSIGNWINNFFGNIYKNSIK